MRNLSGAIALIFCSLASWPTIAEDASKNDKEDQKSKVVRTEEIGAFDIKHIIYTRSGSIKVITDAVTKCQYITVGSSITPRLNAKGGPVCGG